LGGGGVSAARKAAFARVWSDAIGLQVFTQSPPAMPAVADEAIAGIPVI
jgi:hypothetical protein